jgi:hypothetical protein
MKAPQRRERDETRVFKKMGDALGFPSSLGEYLSDSPVRVQSRPYSDSGPSPLWHGTEGQRMATAARDSNVDTDAEREAKHALREEDIEKTNAHNRKKGRTPVVRIDSGASKN